MPGEFLFPLRLRQIAADAGGKRGALDQAGDMLVGEPVGAGLFPACGNSSEQRTVGDASELEPGLKRRDRAGEVAGAASPAESGDGLCW